jgi:hypothetical protein
MVDLTLCQIEKTWAKTKKASNLSHEISSLIWTKVYMKNIKVRRILIIIIIVVLIPWFFVERFEWVELSANAFTELLGPYASSGKPAL